MGFLSLPRDLVMWWLDRRFGCVRACGAGGGGDGVDDGAGVRGLGHEERRHAGLLHGLLQDPGDAQAEQEGALPRQPRRRRRPPRPPQAAPPPAAARRQGSPAAHQARRSGQRPRPAPRPRPLAHRKEEVPELFPVLHQGLKTGCCHRPPSRYRSMKRLSKFSLGSFGVWSSLQ
uniref:Uncharacterized protein n=1 Tax=Triticum urartu TaxID=4572 RepID=A0A8R7Q7U5_TRIUA